MNEKKYFETIDNIILEPTIIDNKVMKEFYIPGYKDIKMLSFFDFNYNWLLEKINHKTIGIYFLINENSNSIYVGQSTDLISRLKNHYQNRKFSKVILFFSDDEWIETIISYLEHKFILELKKIIYSFVKILKMNVSLSIILKKNKWLINHLIL